MIRKKIRLRQVRIKKNSQSNFTLLPPALSIAVCIISTHRVGHGGFLIRQSHTVRLPSILGHSTGHGLTTTPLSIRQGGGVPVLVAHGVGLRAAAPLGPALGVGASSALRERLRL